MKKTPIIKIKVNDPAPPKTYTHEQVEKMILLRHLVRKGEAMKRQSLKKQSLKKKDETMYTLINEIQDEKLDEETDKENEKEDEKEDDTE